MKRLLIITIAALAIIFSSMAKEVYAYNFYPSEAIDLNHNRAYTWSLNFSLGADESITSASFSLLGINNWKIESDFLYVHLLDSVATGVKPYNDSTNGDFFSGQGIHLFTFEDQNQESHINSSGKIKWENPAEDFTYNFSIDDLGFLTSYLNDGFFGVGLDPDCHYSFKQIIFYVETESGGGESGREDIPEPGTLILLGSGLAGLAFFRRR